MTSVWGSQASVDFKNVVVTDVLVDCFACSAQEFVAVHRFTCELKNIWRILFGGWSDLLVFVRVDECADAFVGKDLGQQSLRHATVNEVYARDALSTSCCRMMGLGSLTLGALASSFGLPWPIRVAALLCVVAAVIGWRRIQPPGQKLKANAN